VKFNTDKKDGEEEEEVMVRKSAPKFSEEDRDMIIKNLSQEFVKSKK